MLSRLPIFASVAVAFPLAAQEQARDTARIAPVVVSATSVPLDLGTLPVAVTVITADEIAARGITTVAEALLDLTSAYVAQAGSPGATTSLFLRGGESKYVKVLVDGVPSNEPGGSYDFGSLTTDNVERIEIVRGPASVIHGADAVTGVVHVITKRGTGRPRARVDVRAGMAPRDAVVASRPDPEPMSNMDLTAALDGSLASGSYSLALARHSSTGLYDFNNDNQNNVLSGRFETAPQASTTVRASLRYTDYRFSYPTNSGGAPTDSNAYRTEDRTVLGVEVERTINASLRSVLSLRSSVSDGGTDDAADPGVAQPSSFVSQDKTRRRGAELRLHWLPRPATSLTLGVTAEQQDQRSQSQSMSAFGPFNSVFRGARRSRAGFAEFLLTPTDRITATFGARLDDNERFGTFVTGRVGGSWRPVAYTRVRATIGNAFREPSFFENYSTGFVTGNPDLRPERTRGVDVGVEQWIVPEVADISVTAFAQRFRDMIDYDPATGCGFSYCNVAEAESNGVEVEARVWPVSGLRGGVGATFLRTRVITPGFDQSTGGLYREGESLIRRPEFKLTGELAYAGAGPLRGSLRAFHVGERQDRDFRTFPSQPVTLPSYQRFDLAGEYDVRDATSVTLRIENLTNTGYQNIFNFLAPRRTISAGLRSSF